jgi:RimJ/RimL family protein N-acetyltransferase
MTQKEPVIRPYRDTDLAAVYDVCVRTADAGGDARGKYRSDDLMPDLFAGPYVFLEPDFAFVLDDGNRAVGYVIGTPDTAAFARAYRTRWIPRLADRYPPPPNQSPPNQSPPNQSPPNPNPNPSPDDEMIALHHRPERLIWPGLAEYPAHLHIDLLPPFQRAGHGRALMETFYARARQAGAAGVHVTVAEANTRAIGFYHRLGFRALDPEQPGEAAVVYLGRRL